MPNRILKESICTSEEIESLTEQQEVFFYRLMVSCDDYGLMDARPAILKARCYPLKSFDSKRIQMLLDALHTVGLIRLYEIEGRPYLKMVNWEKHQTIRAKHSKYPIPQADDFICKQMQADVPVIQSNPILSESNPIQSRFADFWDLYPRKEAKEKAKSSWKSANGDSAYDLIIAGLERAKRSDQWQKDGGKFIPHAATWLNQKRWEDEATAQVVPITVTRSYADWICHECGKPASRKQGNAYFCGEHDHVSHIPKSGAA